MNKLKILFLSIILIGTKIYAAILPYNPSEPAAQRSEQDDVVVVEQPEKLAGEIRKAKYLVFARAQRELDKYIANESAEFEDGWMETGDVADQMLTDEMDKFRYVEEVAALPEVPEVKKV